MEATPRTGWFRLEGGILVALGAATLMIPGVAGGPAAMAVGWTLALSGILGLIGVYATRLDAHPLWGLVSAALAIATGLALLAVPKLTTGSSLRLLLSAFLALDGLVLLLFAFDQGRREPGRWRWLAGSALVDLGLALIIALTPSAQAPLLAPIVVGLDLCLAGAALVLLGSRRAD